MTDHGTLNNAQNGPSLSESPHMVSVQQEGRVRFLRACDRCRRRKMRCNDANPCQKCAAAGLECTFHQQDVPPRSSLAAAVPPAATKAPKASSSRSSRRSPSSSQPSKRTRLPSSVERDPAAAAASSEAGNDACSSVSRSPSHSVFERPKTLGPNDTAHFFLASDGLARFAGSTSGWPVLDAARRQTIRRDESKGGRMEGEEPDWSYLSNLLHPSSAEGSQQAALEDEEELEYFPGHALASEQDARDDQTMVSEIIPPDLLSTLILTYLRVVHPKWPIMHLGSFHQALARWGDHSFAALVVSMCMLASRYSDDPRVRTDPNTPASAGVQYFHLFQRLRGHAINRDNVIYAVQSLLLASIFNCVDNVPHALAQSLLADAASRCLDGGLHRRTNNSGLGDEVEREVRARTAWACYALDKELSTICGQPPILRLWDFDVALPAPYPRGALTLETEQMRAEDDRHVKVFRHHVLSAAILEETHRASSHRPEVDNVSLLDQILGATYIDQPDMVKLERTAQHLTQWKAELPEEYRDITVAAFVAAPSSTPVIEHLVAPELTIRLLLAGRKLQLVMLLPEEFSPSANTPDSASLTLSQARGDVLATARELVDVGVQLGSAGLLPHTDILLTYRLLLAGRMILAALLSARAKGARQQTAEAESASQVVSIVLRHIAATHPISLGSADVFDEMCRVCRVNLPQKSRSVLAGSGPKYAWHRPITYRNPAPSVGSQSPAEPKSANQNTLGSVNGTSVNSDGFSLPFLPNTQWTTDSSRGLSASAYDGTNMSMPFLDPFGPLTGSETDFAWFLLGGDSTQNR